MTLSAGAANVVITPPVGVEIAGYGFGPSQGILDDLEAQALYLKLGDEQIVIVTADLLTFGSELVMQVRRRAAGSYGIPEERISFSASHSHSSPTTHSLRQWGQVDETYQRYLEAGLCGAIGMACHSAREARLGLGLGRAENLSENRRGSSGLLDPSVPVLRVDQSDGQPMAVLFNFACHPVSLHSYRNLLSPDYPGYARQTIRAVLGAQVVTMFSLGCAGDINPAGYRPGKITPQRSRQIGAILGCEVAKLALDPQIQEHPALQFRKRVIELPVLPLPPVSELRQMDERFSAAAARLQAEGRPWVELSVSLIQRDWAREALQAREGGLLRDSIPCEIMAMRLGDAALIAAPLELFTQTGLAIKKNSPAKMTIISSNSNGGVGYLPTQDAYGIDDYTNPDGLAPKVYGLYALAEEAESLFRQAAISMLQELF
jgi:hypothetical protein